MGMDYRFDLGEVDNTRIVSWLRQLVDSGYATRVRAITPEGILEAARAGDTVNLRTLPAREAAPILAACTRRGGTLAYETALMLMEDGLQDLEVPGYRGKPVAIHGDGMPERGLMIGGAAALLE